MSVQANIKLQDNTVYLSGDINFTNIMTIYKEALSIFSEPCADIIIDFSEVKSSNSVILAAIINWLKEAKKHKKKLCVRNLNDEMLSLAKSSGVSTLFESVDTN